MSGHILLYIPNVIGYFRIFLLIISWMLFYSSPLGSLAFYMLFILLDAVDGYTARKLNQVSSFGAWFDVVIDNLGRGMMWSRLYSYGYLVASVEWLTFVCNHTAGAKWKEVKRQTPTPIFVTMVMANNFRTMTGIFSIGSLQLLPIWLYAFHTNILSQFYIPAIVQCALIPVLVCGRALSFAVEAWCILTHIEHLLAMDSNHGHK